MTAIGTGSDSLIRDWNYRPSIIWPLLHLSRFVRSTVLRRRAPAYQVLKAAALAARWSVYFMYLAEGGRETAAHRYTIDRLAAEPGKLLVVCASPSPAELPVRLDERCDALIWKDLPGFDFSAYAIALRHIAEASPGADVFVLNDSVFGPFESPAALLADAPWDLTGFTASWKFENHIQSYAFQLRRLTEDRLAALAPVLPRDDAFDRYMDVVICQETRFARCAAAVMTVGARWFVSDRITHNPSLHHAARLTRAGLPFLKRSLLDRYGALQEREELVRILRANGHPLPDQDG